MSYLLILLKSISFIIRFPFYSHLFLFFAFLLPPSPFLSPFPLPPFAISSSPLFLPPFPFSLPPFAISSSSLFLVLLSSFPYPSTLSTSPSFYFLLPFPPVSPSLVPFPLVCLFPVFFRKPLLVLNVLSFSSMRHAPSFITPRGEGKGREGKGREERKFRLRQIY